MTLVWTKHLRLKFGIFEKTPSPFPRMLSMKNKGIYLLDSGKPSVEFKFLINDQANEYDDTYNHLDLKKIIEVMNGSDIQMKRIHVKCTPSFVVKNTIVS